MELILENVRCFVKRQQVPIRPLTLLVGENSSGKSTFLGMLSVVTDATTFPLWPDFNKQPYSFGNFDTIATFKRGNIDRADSFSIGYHRQQGEHSYDMLAKYIPGASDIGFIGWLDVKTEAMGVHVNFTNEKTVAFSILDNGEHVNFFIKKEELRFPSKAITLLHFLGKAYSDAASPEDRIRSLENLLSNNFAYVQDVGTFSIAPVRTSPQRTYDSISEFIKPTGEHVPYLLARILGGTDIGQKDRLEGALEEYGKESGLFSRLRVKRLGKTRNDPFQLLVKTKGEPVNLVDVGYGVSQSLPVIVDSILSNKEDYILLQQPEVHLHPKAQAALGTFFADLVANQKKKFVIETHSDYIIDRVRQEVANRKIKKEDVAILYFDKQGYETTIHQIQLDDLGNVVNPPPGYRQFFLDEQMNLLSRGKNR